MATPRVFVSSTFYDLKYIRENVKYFIKTLGYEPILSEDGDVFYNPRKHTHDSCISEVPTCQIFVLIIGGRFGGTFKDSEKSITNMEYLEAVKKKIPIFALVESSVYSEHHVYNENVNKNTKIKASDVSYPSVDNIKVFHFIDEVRKNSVNNAIVPFKDFTDIESYLKKQWAGMLFNFLEDDINEKRISDTLSEIQKMNEKIEYLSEQILKSVGSEISIITIELYEQLISSQSFRSMAFMERKPKPIDFIRNKSFKECCQALGLEIKPSADTMYTQSTSGEMSLKYYEGIEKDYANVRDQLAKFLKGKKYTFEKYINEYDKKGA